MKRSASVIPHTLADLEMHRLLMKSDKVKNSSFTCKRLHDNLRPYREQLNETTLQGRHHAVFPPELQNSLLEGTSLLEAHDEVGIENKRSHKVRKFSRC
jgi:hypothetical protein